MLIIGIDPGVTNTGYSIYNDSNNVVIESGEIVADAKSIEDKLVQVYNKLSFLLEKYSINIVSYEQPVFLGKGITGEQINRVLGVVLLLFKLNNINDIFSYTAPQIKRKITGNGKADKKEVAVSVSKYFNIDNKFSSTHAADSLGAIMCYLLDK